LFWIAAELPRWFPRRVSAPTITVSKAAARRFMIHATGLAAPHASIGAAIGYHGYVQIDPLNVCGRMHDLILRNRVAGYREGGLMRFLHEGPRVAFESYHPVQGVLAAFPVSDWRFQLLRMHRRLTNSAGYYGRLTRSERDVADNILAEVTRRGPLGPRDFEPGPRRRTAWGSQGTLVKKVFEKLFVHGRLVISSREQFRRIYDLPERVLPPNVFNAPVPTKSEFEAWAVLSLLRQRRLVILRRQDAALVRDQTADVQVDGCPAMFCLRSDLPLLESAAAGELEAADSAPRLLAPLDPLIYDRRIAARLWDFEYTWEVYTPEAKRLRGYYALPVLAGEAVVGHVDPKADREAGRLRVRKHQDSRRWSSGCTFDIRRCRYD
jgi:uncharacterized protein YcaQ